MVLPWVRVRGAVEARIFSGICVKGLWEGSAGRGRRGWGAFEARVFSGALPLGPHFLSCLDTRKEAKKIKAKQKSGALCRKARITGKVEF
jgi:hypothetical protein